MTYSEQTYDWNRLRKQGEMYIDLLEQLKAREELSRPEVEFLINGATGVESDPLTNADKNITQFDICGYEDWQPFLLRIRLEAERTYVRFEIRPDFSDDRTAIDSDISSADLDRSRRLLEYTFEIRREALELSKNTLLSDREAEVVLLLKQGCSVDEIADISDIPSTSNIRTYIDRIYNRAEEAQQKRETAELTIDVLESIEAPA